MKKYNDFIFEHQKFQEHQYVRRKSDGEVGIISYVNTYSNGVNRYMKYSIDFDGGKVKKYLAKHLEKIDKLTKEDVDRVQDRIQIVKNMKKFNL